MRSAPSPQLNELVALAAKLCAAPAALLTIVGEDTVWIRASSGIDDREPLPAKEALCAEVVLQNKTIAASFQRDWTHFTFYAGAPVYLHGTPAGALCVLDQSPRAFSPDQRDALEAIARAASTVLAQQERLTVSHVDDEAIRTVLQLTDNGIAIFRVAPHASRPIVEYANDAVLRRAGMTLSEMTDDNASFLQRYGQEHELDDFIVRAREGDDSPVEIAFNAKYLSDVLNVLDSEGLHIELTEPLRPGLIRPTDDADYLCVLMPMQVVYRVKFSSCSPNTPGRNTTSAPPFWQTTRSTRVSRMSRLVMPGTSGCVSTSQASRNAAVTANGLAFLADALASRRALSWIS